jgi:hypothetical protein
MMKIFARTVRESGKHFHHFVRERSRRCHTVLCALQLRRGNHFHGLRDLLRVLDRLNPPANV